MLSVLLLAAACGGDQPAQAAQTFTADAHTQAAIGRMDAVLAAAPVADDTTDAGLFHQLGTALQQEVTALIGGCTMTGPDHERLHVWLNDYLPAVQTLQQEHDLAGLRAARAQVASALQEFHALFPPAK
jgi:hypothetical protein